LTLRSPLRPPRRGRLFPLAALATGVLSACPGGGPADDDTIAFDDDDFTPVEFDDCVGEALAVAEVEPNDASAPQAIATDGDLVLTGSCSTSANDGRQWTGDVDAFLVTWTCGGRARFRLEWDPSAGQDTDVRVTAPSIDPNGFVWHGFTPSTNPGESGVADAGGEMLVEVLCWEGPDDATWTFTIDWPRSPDWVPPGDDDDAVDDDDSAPADDDDAADDDDSAPADDDDAVDDDDSAPADDDDAVDDDDSAAGG